MVARTNRRAYPLPSLWDRACGSTWGEATPSVAFKKLLQLAHSRVRPITHLQHPRVRGYEVVPFNKQVDLRAIRVTARDLTGRQNFLGYYLRSEYAIAYQLDRLRALVAAVGTVPLEARNDPNNFPSLAFAPQVLRVLEGSTVKQARAFVKRVRTAFSSSENMHGLRLELQAATHFVRRGQHVVWHRVNNGGSFDLLIDDLGLAGLEVECKSISENKGRRVHRRDALELWGQLWKDIASVAQNLHSGLAVVLTVSYRLPVDATDRAALAEAVVARVLAGSGAALDRGIGLRIQPFEPKETETAKDAGREVLRTAIDRHD